MVEATLIPQQSHSPQTASGPLVGAASPDRRRSQPSKQTGWSWLDVSVRPYSPTWPIFLATRRCLKVEHKTKKWNLDSDWHLGTSKPNPPCLSPSRVSSAAFSSNNNIFMSPPTTKQRAPLIGRRPSERALRERWLVTKWKGLNSLVCLFFFTETLPMSGVQLRLWSLPLRPLRSSCYLCTRFHYVSYTDVMCFIGRWAEFVQPIGCFV